MSMQRAYEAMVIFDTGLEPGVLENAIRRAEEILRTAGATVTATEKLGKRTLAYSIDHHDEGSYVLYHFETDGSAISQIEHALYLVDEIIRHKVIRLPDNYTRKVKWSEARESPKIPRVSV
ncbi:MAG: 30S ribosomal protein S6 [Acidimicrobiales bacterium]